MIEPETAEIVRRIFELAATGMNPHRIAKPYRQREEDYTEYIFPQIGYGQPISRQKAGNRRL